MTVAGLVWEVVGGARSGGIVVRAEKDRSSPEAPSRLLPGALVRAVECDNETGRLRYEKVSGGGPGSGWVAIRSQGKELLRPWKGPQGGEPIWASPAAKEGPEEASAVQAEGPRRQNPTIGRVTKQPSKSAKKAVTTSDLNGKSLGGLATVRYDQWQAKARAGALGQKALADAQRKQGCGKEEGAQEGGRLLCFACKLPIGELCYDDEEEGAPVHGECQAQLLLQRARQEEKLRKRRDVELKKKRRADYDIGWKCERVPRNVGPARQLGYPVVPHGMYCLVLAEDTNSVRLAPTTDAAASTNLEYLAVALQVRALEGREPLFSLDPKGATDRARAEWQVKRFEPEWLAGTSVGEVMFQADVHLKELSMGEYSQPVLGMRSCFDLSEEGEKDEEWNAREWFVVRKAEVRMSPDDALIPFVEMGVEARDQVAGPNGLEDSLITSPEHPLVKYAADFEHYFDVIAERKSVIHHLRELAKASVLAKFLVDSEVQIEEAWADVAGAAAVEECCAEIPQLWNERYYSQIQVKDGLIVDAEKGIGERKRGLYGGVEFGLEKVQAPGVAVRARGPPLTMAKGQLSRVTTGSGLLATGQEGFSYARAPGVAAVPRGVDLNLDTFSLTSATRVGPAAAADFPLGGGFFRALDAAAGAKDSAPAFSEEDAGLFRALFNAKLSDRRDEGDLFVPPDASAEHIEKLRSLIGDEAAVQQQRREHFLSEAFDMQDGGPLFPASWAQPLGIANGKGAQGARTLHARPDYRIRVDRVLKAATPVFDKSVEDGTKFRIYQVGSLEVRTIQEHDGPEKAGVVYSTRAPAQAPRPGADGENRAQRTIVKAVQYVEASGGKDSKPLAHFYVVFEADDGSVIVTERLSTGRVAWTEGPEDLEARNVLARVTRSVDCRAAGVTVEEAKAYYDGEAGQGGSYASQADCERYAQEVYGLVLPALQRSWLALFEHEKQAVELLGLCAVWGQGKDACGAGSLSWRDLDEAQRELAAALGFDEAAWGKVVCWVPKDCSWAQLTQEQRQAAKELAVAGAEDWDGASRDQLRQRLGGAWKKTWARLTPAEQRAAKVLGVVGAGMWDTACWKLGGAWERTWDQLTEAEKEAAKELGAPCAHSWDKRAAKVWRAGWQDLTPEQVAAAGRLGFDREAWAKF